MKPFDLVPTDEDRWEEHTDTALRGAKAENLDIGSRAGVKATLKQVARKLNGSGLRDVEFFDLLIEALAADRARREPEPYDPPPVTENLANYALHKRRYMERRAKVNEGV
jgi:hypothetical protein